MRLFQNTNFRFFFEFLKCLQRVLPLIFFIFCNKLDFQKAERVHLFTILKTWRFLSLRYSADFKRSRLVTLLLHFRWPLLAKRSRNSLQRLSVL